jgi:polysaccharide export outer membrane protein
MKISLRPAPRALIRSLVSLQAVLGAAGVLALALGTGCEAPPAIPTGEAETHAEMTLREGDVVKVTFPGAPNLDVAPQPVRRDGKITMPIIGEVTAAGLTPIDLQDQLMKQLAGQLQTKEVVVSVVSASFSVFVDGSVLRPGKIETDHPITILEAVMEAGGFDYEHADTGNILVIRHKEGSKGYDYITIDLKQVTQGKKADLFYLSPNDVVHVPKKFNWF